MKNKLNLILISFKAKQNLALLAIVGWMLVTVGSAYCKVELIKKNVGRLK